MLVPTYALYGEYLEESHEDVLHFEPLHERSAKHDWSIQPHRHDTLWQIFYLRDSGVLMQLNGAEIRTDGPVFVLIPPLFVHAFQFPKDTFGGVLSIRNQVVLDILNDVAGSELLNGRIMVVEESAPGFSSLLRSQANVESNFQKIDMLRTHGLESDLKSMLVSLIRHAQSAHAGDLPALLNQNDDLMRNFCDLVEKNFATNWSTARYASELRVSEVSLNRKCKVVLGTSPKKMLTKRRMLEAKRLLQFTRLPIAQISEQLGYADPSYFCRMFKKQLKQSPAVFRREQAI